MLLNSDAVEVKHHLFDNDKHRNFTTQNSFMYYFPPLRHQGSVFEGIVTPTVSIQA
jgi:hypothetical protein